MEFEFTLVVSGPICCQIGSEEIVLNKGDGCFINSGAIHRWSAKGGGVLKNILFAKEFLAQESSAVYQKYIAPVASSTIKYFVLQPKQTQRLLDICEEVQKTSPIWELHIRNFVSAFWECFFLEISELLVARETPADCLLQARMRFMLDFIQREYKDISALEQIAAAANISKSEALRCFHQSIQTTPMKYLNEYRLNRARVLLRTSSATISSIAWDSGYHSAGYFCRAFKNRFGMTPESYRKISTELI